MTDGVTPVDVTTAATDATPALPAVLGAVIAVVVVVILVTLIVVGFARRVPRARSAALAARSHAAASLIELDDALADLDLDLSLSGALHDPAAPLPVRRARMTAQHTRDDAYAELHENGVGASPADIRRAALLVERSTTDALASVVGARREHDAWVRAHAAPSTLIGAARSRLAAMREALGDPAALIRDLSRFDESEWRDAADAAADAVEAAAEADSRLTEAEAVAADPQGDARPALEAAERALRRAATDARTLEETHRIVVDAARAVPGELAAAEAALREAADAAPAMRPVDAERVASAVAAAAVTLDQARGEAPRRPVAAVHTIVLLRARLDDVLADGLSTQQRERSSRNALPATLAAARAAVAHAEAALREGADVEARLMLADALHDLATARGAQNAHQAATAARRAILGADRAVSLMTTNE